MKTFILLPAILFFFFQNSYTPDMRGLPVVNPDYFWNRERNTKLLKLKPKTNVLKETIRNGYYAKEEYLTFINKQLSTIKYLENGDTVTVKTFAGGSGFLKSKGDTINIVNGKLNGESYYHDYYPEERPSLKNKGVVPISKEPERIIITYKNNYVLSFRAYRKNILVFECFYKGYDCISHANNHTPSDYLDSAYTVYNKDGSLKYAGKYKSPFSRGY